MERRPTMRYSIVMFITDLVAVMLSSAAAFLLKFRGRYVQEFPNRWREFLVIFVILIAAFSFKRLYSQRRLFYEETREIVEALLLTLILVFGFFAMTRTDPDYSRLFIGLSIAFAFVLVPAFRWLSKRLFNGYLKEDLIIVEGPECEKVRNFFEKEWYLAYRPVATVKLEDLKEWIGKVENVVLTRIPFLHEFYDELAHLSIHFKRVFYVPEISGIPLANQILHFSITQNLPIFETFSQRRSLLWGTIKRTFDIIFSLLVLILLSPLLLIIAILIKLDSEGPVIFRQVRVGKDGKLFVSYKFRTMYVDAEERLKEILENDPEARKEWETYWKLKNDPRVTRVGRWLRKTSLDELPQFFNVLKGDMSVVGPRPYIPSELKHIQEYAKIILSVRPGITGLWQVSGRNEVGYRVRMLLDTLYVVNWSFWLDMVIIFKTILVVLKGKGY